VLAIRRSLVVARLTVCATHSPDHPCRRNRRFCRNRATMSTAHRGRTLLALDRRPVCHTVSNAAVKSTKTAPVFRPCWKPFSMNVVSAQTWSLVLLPWRKPAWLGDRTASTVGAILRRMILSSSLKHMLRREIGLACSVMQQLGLSLQAITKHCSVYVDSLNTSQVPPLAGSGHF